MQCQKRPSGTTCRAGETSVGDETSVEDETTNEITMTAISEAGHNWFMQRLETNAGPGQQQLVKDELKKLQSLYREYQVKMGRLQQLAGQYEATRQK